MRRLLALMGLSLCFVTPLGATPVNIGGGVEQFVWQEYDDGGNKLLKDSGPRLFLSVDAENAVSNRWTYGFHGKFYSATVDCEGQMKSGASCLGETDYEGLSANVDFTGRFLAAAGGYSNFGLRFGFGGEAWRRHLPGVAGYTEEYTVVSGKLGVAYAPEQGLFGDVGIKYPITASEQIDLYDDVKLSPKGAVSLYVSAGYNLNQRWSIKGYYDSYRFKSSDPESLYNGGTLVGAVSQPESNMDVFGINVGFFF